MTEPACRHLDRVVTSVAVTVHPTGTRPPTSPAPLTPSSRLTSRVRTGGGATPIRWWWRFRALRRTPIP